MDLPKTKNPEKYIADAAVSKKDFTNNKVGDTDLNDLFSGSEKPKFTFKDGYAINNETGEKVQL